MNRKKVVVLLSGGMDSVTALYDSAARHEVVGALSFDYGSKHNAREIPFARWHAENLGVPHRVVELPFIGGEFASDLLASGGAIPKGPYCEETMKQTVVPFRNGIMLSVAAGWAESRGASGVVIAAHAGDHAVYPDCRSEFMRAMGEAIRLGTYGKLEILAPFVGMTKGQIAQRARDLGVDLSRTWSCYVGGDVHCGECATCIERREAFELAGLEDITGYLNPGVRPAAAGGGPVR